MRLGIAVSLGVEGYHASEFAPSLVDRPQDASHARRGRVEEPAAGEESRSKSTMIFMKDHWGEGNTRNSGRIQSLYRPRSHENLRKNTPLIGITSSGAGKQLLDTEIMGSLWARNQLISHIFPTYSPHIVNKVPTSTINQQNPHTFP